MKIATIAFAVALALGISWALGYRTGALDEGAKNRAEILSLREEVDSYSDAFQRLSDERVGLIIKANKGGNHERMRRMPPRR